MEPKPIPEPTLRRLPTYHHHLQALEARNITVVSCSTLGRDLGIDPNQIRKDFEFAGIAGKPRVGYGVQVLLQSLTQTLGWNEVKPAVLVGAESLGRALAGFEEFRRFGLRIVAIFDTDERRIGHPIEGLEVLPLGFLPDVARLLKARVGILTLPAGAAQSAADLMVRGGVEAIWNFTPMAVRVPEHVLVQNEDMFYSLAAISSRLSRNSAKEER